MELIAGKNVKAVLYQGRMSHLATEALFESGIPNFPAGELKIHRLGDFAVVDRENLNRLISRWRKETFRIIDLHKSEMVQNLLDEYKINRMKDQN